MATLLSLFAFSALLSGCCSQGNPLPTAKYHTGFYRQANHFRATATYTGTSLSSEHKTAG